MRIGLVCRHFIAAKGGLEKYTVTLAEHLVDQGHEVHVFANTGDTTSRIRLHHVPLFPLSSPGKNLSFAHMAANRVARFNLDVVQSMERIWTQDIYRASDGINPVQMMTRYPNPYLRRFKAAGPRRLVLSLLEKRIFERNGARFVMANSNLVKDHICQHYRIHQDKIHVIYNSVDGLRYNPGIRERLRPETQHRFGAAADELLILFAGNNFRLKGLDIMIKAMGLPSTGKIRLLVAGNDASGPFRRLAAKCGLGDRVFFLGHQKALETLYAAADLLVLPSRYDAFANVCLEAMACGTPVITTQTNGAAEIIEPHRNGYILSSLDAAELAALIENFMSLSDRSTMRRRASDTATAFTKERYMHQLLGLYDLVSEEKKR